MAATNPVPAGSPAQTGSALVKSPSARLPGIVSRSGPLGRMAQARGRATAHRRGLMNSSLAAEAGHKALLDFAVPLAQADTTTDLANQERLAANARHAASVAVQRYSVDSENNRHAATLELQRYGIDETTARHAVDAAFREKELTVRTGLEREKIQADHENLVLSLEKRTADLERQITADQAAQRRAIAANDRQQANQLAESARQHQAQLQQARAELAATQQRHQQNLAEARAGREQERRSQFSTFMQNANAQYTQQVGIIRATMDKYEDDAALQTALDDVRKNMDAQVRFAESEFDIDADWTFWSPPGAAPAPTPTPQQRPTGGPRRGGSYR